MEVKVRDICPGCEGTGRAMTDAEAEQKAITHNRAARQCHIPNFLRASDFIDCKKCRGSGKLEQWISVEDLARILCAANPEADAHGVDIVVAP